MNETIKNILTRRSIRRFKDEQVPEPELLDILAAAQHAPSGSNSQSWHFLVIQNRDVLAGLNRLVREAFAAYEVSDDTYISLRKGKEAALNESYSFYYNAPLLVVVTNKKSYPNAMADCACALENMQIAAHSLGLGSCWINQLAWFGEIPAVREKLESLGMPADDAVFGSLAVGFPVSGVPAVPARKGDPFIFIR